MIFQFKSKLVLNQLFRGFRGCHSKVNADFSQTNSRAKWKSVIGLEIHAQLSTNTKLFSSAPAIYGAPTNSAVALFDAAIPGTLPVLNKAAVELAVSSALALGCKINPISYFDRKHYFYSDLPAGYQITQHQVPIAVNGKVDYAIYQPGIHKEPYYKSCRIKQIQLEQDSGKSFHEETEKLSFIDLNRAGTALIEIVFEPEVEDENEACDLVKEVINILERVGSCSCKLEEGSLRIDANVSVNKVGDGLGVRTEIKNIGSIHGVRNAVKYEIMRQKRIIVHGGTVENKTLAWDSENNETVVMRDKEERQDYRFMPEPNLPPLRLMLDDNSENIHGNIRSKHLIFNVSHLKDKIPNLPHDERVFLKEKYGLNDSYAYNLVNQRPVYNFFSQIMIENPSRDQKIVYLLLMYELRMILKKANLELEDCTLSASHLGEIVDLLQGRKISKLTADILLEKILVPENTLTPIEMVKEYNLEMIYCPKELKKLCLKVMESEKGLVNFYNREKKNKKIIFNQLMGKALKESQYRADAKLLSEVMKQVLESKKES